MRSKGDVRRRKIRKRREESRDTIVGAEFSMRKARKPNDNPKTERNATRSREVCQLPKLQSHQLHRRAVVSLYAAVVTAVSEIDHQPDAEPNDQPRPVDPPEVVHHITVKEDSENRHNRPALAGSRQNGRRLTQPGLRDLTIRETDAAG